jgi:hypothetical protein
VAGVDAPDRVPDDGAWPSVGDAIAAAARAAMTVGMRMGLSPCLHPAAATAAGRLVLRLAPARREDEELIFA